MDLALAAGESAFYFRNGSVLTGFARGCPGKYLGVQTIWIALVRLIWGFNITHTRDENGQIIQPDPTNATPGITSSVQFTGSSSPRV